MTFKNKVEATYTLVEVDAKLHGLLAHPLSDRLKLLKKVTPQAGPSTVIAYDLKEGVWSDLFGKFSVELAKHNIAIKPPLDKTPHVTLAYIINATDDEVEKAKELAKPITPLTVQGVSFLKGKMTKDIYVVLDLAVTSAYRKVFNAIEAMVGRDRIVDYRTVWQGHIPHASIGIIADVGDREKEAQKSLSQIAKSEKITFMPKFVEVHLNTKVGGPFTPEMVDWKEV